MIEGWSWDHIAAMSALGFCLAMELGLMCLLYKEGNVYKRVLEAHPHYIKKEKWYRFRS